MLGGNPVFTAPGGPEVRGAARQGRRCASITGSTPTRPRTSATGTSPTRTRSRAGATRARTTAPSRSCSRSSRRSTTGARRTKCSASFTRAARSARLRRSSRTTGRARSAGGTRLDDPRRDGQPFKNADTFWRHALHDGFIAGTAIADGGPATPFVRAPTAGAVAATPAVPAGRRCTDTAPRAGRPPAQLRAPHAPPPRRRPRDHLPARPDDLGRPLREQRLAPGTAEAADEGHVGHRRRGSARSSRRSAACSDGDIIELKLPRQHRAAAGLPRPRASGSSRSRCSSATAARWPDASAPPTKEAEAFNALSAAHLGRAVVRQRPRDREDRRPLSRWRPRRNIT